MVGRVGKVGKAQKSKGKRNTAKPKKPDSSQPSRVRSALSRIQQNAVARGVSQLTMDEIDAIIAKARREKRKGK